MTPQTNSKWTQYQKGIILFLLYIGVAFLVASLLTLGIIYAGFLGSMGSSSIAELGHFLMSYSLPILILAFSLLVILLPNPIYALICLILVFFTTALFLLSIQVNFLAMIYLIIYIGAIAILFLFVIMMFNLRELQQQSTHLNDYSFLSISFSLCFLFLCRFMLLISDRISTLVAFDKYFNEYTKIKLNSLRYFLTYQHNDILLFGTLLYDYYSYLFLVAALILLTSMLGSIILALSTTEQTIHSHANSSAVVQGPKSWPKGQSKK